MSDADKHLGLIIVQGHNHGNALDISLSMGSYYSEHILGEGADIGLHRDSETGKVVGGRLPFYASKLTIVVVGDVEVEVIREAEVSNERS